MVEEILTVTTLDLKGMVCPIPIVKVSQAIKLIKVGEAIEAFATDPGVLLDIPAWAKSTGNEVLSIKKEDKVIKFFIKRVK